MLREVAVCANIASGRFAAKRLSARFRTGCDARPIMLVPGFLAAPRSMFVLEDVLRRTGYRLAGWGQGRNLGCRSDTLDRLARNVSDFAERCDDRVTLIGWSLGGIFARELAKLRPDLVREVLTLGSPFSGNVRANNAWRVYERVAGHPVDAPPIVCDLGGKPDVPTTAFWSRRDGIVAPVCARGMSGERDHAVELDCGHFGFPSKPSALEAILSHLAAGAQRQG